MPKGSKDRPAPKATATRAARWRGGFAIRPRLNAPLFPAPAARPAAKAKPINLALQGGGAHGAFTWGVLDRLLEDGRLEVAAVSGTSAGAVNAVALAAGLAAGGPEAAREKLDEIWRMVAGAPSQASTTKPSPPSESGVASAGVLAFDVLTRLFSPYDLNPLDINPLRDVLAAAIDFKALNGPGAPKLFIAATELATGRAKIFTSPKITLDVVLASACLPSLHKAVKIGRQHYWDGGFSANPALMPLVTGPGAEDSLLVQLDPLRDPEVPTRAQDIVGQVNRITFNQPLQREVELIEQGRRLATGRLGFTRRARRRLARHRFHLIEATRYTRGLSRASKLRPDWDLLSYLRDGGRRLAGAWLGRNLDQVGRRSSVDLAAKFLLEG